MSETPSGTDRELYGEVSVDPEDQLQSDDTLVERGLVDVLDEGYSPPDREPRDLREGTTWNEQHDGPTLDERLAAEVPDAGIELDDLDPDADYFGAPDPRAGRLVAPDQGLGEDVDSEEWATDVGIDGAGASAEEAAMHVISDSEPDY
jgi:hypothetical protein